MAPPEIGIYGAPTLHIHPNLAAAKEFSDTHGASYFWSDQNWSLQMPLWTNVTSQSANLV
jgi:hypothetical protein